MEIYNDLLIQYNSLSEDEKRAILIYKHSLYYHINEISKIENFENRDAFSLFDEITDKTKFVNNFEEFKKVINYPQNMIIKLSVFKNIDLSNIYNFIESMKCVYSILVSSRLKIKLNSDLAVYRGISITDNQNINVVSNSKLISTSIKVDDANDFIYQEGYEQSHLFVLSLKEGTNVLVSPLTIVYDYKDALSMLKNDKKNATLKIANRGSFGQQEIILFNDDLIFNELSIDEVDVGEKNKLIVHKIDTELVLKKKNHK